MNTEIKQKWINALKSKKYLQGKGYLKQKDFDNSLRYCCLGVLCDLYVKDKDTPKNIHWEKKNRHDNIYSIHKYNGVLPNEVMAWAEITSDSAVLNHIVLNHAVLGRKNLMSLNDSGSSFEEIANIIESNF